MNAGASAVIGHGPHVLRGIEMYKGGVIFYSLGILYLKTILQRISRLIFLRSTECRRTPRSVRAWIKRSRGGKAGLGSKQKMCGIRDRQMDMGERKDQRIYLHPITLDQELSSYRRGLPRLTGDECSAGTDAGTVHGKWIPG